MFTGNLGGSVELYGTIKSWFTLDNSNFDFLYKSSMSFFICLRPKTDGIILEYRNRDNDVINLQFEIYGSTDPMTIKITLASYQLEAPNTVSIANWNHVGFTFSAQT